MITTCLCVCVCVCVHVCTTLLYDMLCFKFEIYFKLLTMKYECYSKSLNGFCIFLNFQKFENCLFLDL
jgi:hypothetical protein